MSSNYPPGVTGNEPQIAGPRSEQMMHRSCEDDCIFIPLNLANVMLAEYMTFAADAIGSPPGTTERGEFLKQRWIQLLEAHQIETSCGWEGEVEVQAWGDGMAGWECPRCNNTNEFDLGAEQDEQIREEREERLRDMRYDDGL